MNSTVLASTTKQQSHQYYYSIKTDNVTREQIDNYFTNYWYK